MKKIVLLSLFIWFTLLSSAYAVVPVLNFSDITSGPKTGLGDGVGEGAIVTIWGQNLGDTQGASTIQFIDSAAVSWNITTYSHVYYWCKADGGTSGGGPAELYSSHRMQEIAFSIPSEVADGAGTITVTVGGQTSNTLPFTIRAGNIYYVSTAGNNANAGSWAAPWRTVSWSAGAAGKMAAGDIVYIVGTYTEATIYVHKNNQGTAASPISMIVYPGATSTSEGVMNYDSNGCDPATTGGAEYWNYSKLRIVVDVGDGIIPAGHARVVGLEVTDTICAWTMASGPLGGSYRLFGGQKFFGNYVHDNGCEWTQAKIDETGQAIIHGHATYSTNRCGSPIDAPEFAWNYFKDNQQANGIHLYDASPYGDLTGTYKVHHNVINGQVNHGIDVNSSGWSQPMEWYCNLIINAGKTNTGYTANGSLIRIEGGGTSYIKIYNNTLISTSSDLTAALISNISSDFFWELRNNVFYTSANKTLYTISGKAASASTNNAWYDTDTVFSAPAWDTTPIITNPLLDANYSPQAGSPLLNVGYNTSATVGATDLYGNPWGTMDIGAISGGGSAGSITLGTGGRITIGSGGTIVVNP